MSEKAKAKDKTLRIVTGPDSVDTDPEALPTDAWSNRLIAGDNLDTMAALLPELAGPLYDAGLRRITGAARGRVAAPAVGGTGNHA